MDADCCLCYIVLLHCTLNIYIYKLYAMFIYIYIIQIWAALYILYMDIVISISINRNIEIVPSNRASVSQRYKELHGTNMRNDVPIPPSEISHKAGPERI